MPSHAFLSCFAATAVILGAASPSFAQNPDVGARIEAGRTALWAGDGVQAEAVFLAIERELEAAALGQGAEAARTRLGLQAARCLASSCVEAPAVMRTARATVAAAYGEDHIETLIADAHLTDALRINGLHAEALATVQPAAARAETALGATHPTTLWLRASEVYALDALGRLDEAERAMGLVIEGWIANGWADTLQTRSALLFRAGLLQQLERPSEAEAILGRLLDLPDLTPEQAGGAWTILAGVLHHLGRFDDAVVAARRGAETFATALGPDHRETLRARAHLGVALGEAGYNEQALALLRESADQSSIILGPHDPHTEAAIYNLAAFLHSTGRPGEAVSLFKGLIDQSADVDVQKNAQQHLGLTLSVLGRTAEAVVEAERAVEMQAGPDSTGLAISLISLGQIYSEASRHGEALAVLEQAAAMNERLDSSWSIRSAAWLALGEAQMAMGDPGGAELSLGLAKALADPQLTPGHPRRIYRDARLSAALVALDRPGDALALLRPSAPLVIGRMRGADLAAGFDAHGSDRIFFSRLVEASWAVANRTFPPQI